jgi:hypothetical protein
LLGTDRDDAIAKQIGQTASAVTTKRVRRKISAFSEWPTGGRRPRMDSEVKLLGTADDEVIAERVGRTAGAVMQKQQVLKVPILRDRRRG